MKVEDSINWQPNPFFKPVKAQLSAKIDKSVDNSNLTHSPLGARRMSERQ